MARVSSMTLEPWMSPLVVTIPGLPWASVLTPPLSTTPPRVSRMPAPLCSPNLPLTCTAGVRTPSSLLSSSLTVRIVSRNVKELTLTKCNLTNTTLAPLIRVSTSTRSPFARKNTSPLARATSRALTTPRFSWFCPMQLCRELTPRRYVSTP